MDKYDDIDDLLDSLSSSDKEKDNFINLSYSGQYVNVVKSAIERVQEVESKGGNPIDVADVFLQISKSMYLAIEIE